MSYATQKTAPKSDGTAGANKSAQSGSAGVSKHSKSSVTPKLGAGVAKPALSSTQTLKVKPTAKNGSSKLSPTSKSSKATKSLPSSTSTSCDDSSRISLVKLIL